jgi:hypothetical protein
MLHAVAVWLHRAHTSFPFHSHSRSRSHSPHTPLSSVQKYGFSTPDPRQGTQFQLKLQTLPSRGNKLSCSRCVGRVIVVRKGLKTHNTQAPACRCAHARSTHGITSANSNTGPS